MSGKNRLRGLSNEHLEGIVLLLKNLKIWDGESDSIDAGMDAVQIENGVIVDIGSSDTLKGADERDMGGLYLIPGLIDAHVHMCLDPEIMNPADQLTERSVLLESMKTRAESMLAAGITSARDLGGGNWVELELRDLINNGEIRGPRLVCAGQPITSVGGHCHFWGGETRSSAEIEAIMDRQAEKGVDLIKIMATGGTMTKGTLPSKAQFDQAFISEVVRQAAKRDYSVAAHCHGTEGILFAARAGVKTIEHCSWVGEEGWGKHYDDEAVSEIVSANAWVSPTINAGWKRHQGKGGFENVLMDNFRKMKQAGVQLIASTDAGIPRVFHHHLPQALPVFAHIAGLTNLEVLKSATSDCAVAIGLGNHAGKIKPDFAADFVLYEVNPLENLSVLERPIEVWSRGLPYC